MAKKKFINIKRYKRKDGTTVKPHKRKKRPKGKRIKLSKQKFVARRDEFGRILGFRPVKKS